MATDVCVSSSPLHNCSRSISILSFGRIDFKISLGGGILDLGGEGVCGNDSNLLAQTKVTGNRYFQTNKTFSVAIFHSTNNKAHASAVDQNNRTRRQPPVFDLASLV
jgi:hypothetical protein